VSRTVSSSTASCSHSFPRSMRRWRPQTVRDLAASCLQFPRARGTLWDRRAALLTFTLSYARIAELEGRNQRESKSYLKESPALGVRDVRPNEIRGRYRSQSDDATSRAEALDVRVAVGGKLLDGGVRRVCNVPKCSMSASPSRRLLTEGRVSVAVIRFM
jgi:hypothetical protein